MDTAPILVGFDPSTRDRAPLHFGIAAARFTGAPLAVVSVHGGGALRERLSHSEVRDVTAEDARSALDELRQEGFDADFQAVEAHTAARGLHSEIERIGAGIAVLGSTHRGTAGRVAPGSTAERVIHGAACAVAVVPRDYAAQGLQTIAAAFVPSDEGCAALRAAAGLARAAGAKLRIVTVLKDEPGAVEGAHVATTGVRLNQTREDHATEHRGDAERALAGGDAEVPSDVEIEHEVMYGSPADLLAGVSRHVDLLVMGSRAYGPQRAVLLGGVGHHVLPGSSCPVLVLPRGVELSLDGA